MSFSLGELAVRFGCELRGDPALEVRNVAPLASASDGAVAFLANPLYKSQLAATRATVVVLDEDSAKACPVAALITGNPYATYARIAAALYPAPVAEAGIHPSAVIGAGATIHPTAHVGPLAFIGARSVVGERAFVGSHCVLEENVALAEDARLVARVTLCRGTSIGARSLIQPGVVIGADGFGFAQQDREWLKVPQVGAVRIGADVEVGANTTIDRGAIEDTVIEDGVKLDNLIQVGHNVRIGAHTAVAGCVGISGSTVIGKRCMIGGASGIAGHIDICDDAMITGFSMVTHSITRPGVYSGGIPVEDARSWRRIVARLKRIESLADRLTALERANAGKPSP